MTADLDTEWLACTWHLLTDHPAPGQPGAVAPSVLLAGTLDEPLLRMIDEHGEERILANVCRACGSILVERAREKLDALRCVDCDTAHDPADVDLVHVATGRWGPLRFASLQPAHALADLLGPLPSALGDRPIDAATRSETCSRDFHVSAPWLAYVEDAATIPDASPSRTWDLGIGWPHRWILAPGTIIDAHHWGLSVRAVQPLAPRSTRVVLESWIWDPSAAPDPADITATHYAIERRVVRRARGRDSHAHESRDWTPPAGVEALRDVLASIRPA